MAGLTKPTVQSTLPCEFQSVMKGALGPEHQRDFVHIVKTLLTLDSARQSR